MKLKEIMKRIGNYIDFDCIVFVGIVLSTCLLLIMIGKYISCGVLK